jgi:N-methylhydantoinase B
MQSGALPGGDAPSPGEFGPIETEVFRHFFTSIAEEMGASLRRASFSPNIKERRDYSCAVFSPAGDPVAQGDHMPVHLGAMPMSVQAAIAALGPLSDGDVVVSNDPFQGGTHLPDLTLLAPVMDARGDFLLGYVAVRAHHSDIGGMSAGSMPLSREIFHEGLRIPPVHLRRGGRNVDEVWKLILANVRTPSEREADLEAQLGALHTGARRLRELAQTKGGDRVRKAQDHLIAYGERLLREGIRRIPDGTWSAEDALEDDGSGAGPFPLKVAVTVRGESVRVDFAGTAPQVAGPVNAVLAVTASACRYVVRCVVEDLLGVSLPAGGGAMKALEVHVPPGTVLNALLPAAVAAGNVETSQRATDVLLRAFAAALPDRMPALSQGTMNNLAVGGTDPRTGAAFTYYDTVGGGMGAGPSTPGLSGVHTHMSNTLNTPVEALERAYPFRVTRYQLRRGSGGRGLHRGGDGLLREIELLAPAEVTLLTERRRSGPSGAEGGEAGAPGENRLVRDGVETPLPGKVTFHAGAGDRISIASPGGGGWGRSR